MTETLLTEIIRRAVLKNLPDSLFENVAPRGLRRSQQDLEVIPAMGTGAELSAVAVGRQQLHAVNVQHIPEFDVGDRKRLPSNRRVPSIPANRG